MFIVDHLETCSRKKEGKMFTVDHLKTATRNKLIENVHCRSSWNMQQEKGGGNVHSRLMTNVHC